MDAYWLDWTQYFLRFLHVVAAIAWIGASFYFVWLDNSLEKPQDPALLSKGVGGELWAVHGGGFYNPQKYLIAPKHLPGRLHWFYWESYTTWLSGFVLFAVVYLASPKVMLIAPAKWAASPAQAIAAALALLFGFYLAYDLACRLFAARPRVLTAAIFGLVAAAICLVSSLFTGRAAVILGGGMLATAMTANVLLVIIPGQKRTVAAMRAGNSVDPRLGMRGKQRSVHNTYFTLPVVLAMVSNHFPRFYNHPHTAVLLLSLMAMGVAMRQGFLLRHKGQSGLSMMATAVLLGGALLVFGKVTSPSAAPASPSNKVEADASADRRLLARAHAVLTLRCAPCHSDSPELMQSAPQQLIFDTAEQQVQHADIILQNAVVSGAMPPGNLTKMTDEERELIKIWHQRVTRGA